MKYDLKDAVETLLDETIPAYDRAIELYRFKVAVLYSKSFGLGEREEETARGGVLSFSNAAMYARRYAICKILHYLGRSLSEQSGKDVTLAQLRKNIDYKRLSNDLIRYYGGWRGLIVLPTMHEFDRALAERKLGAKSIAKALDVSSRYVKNPEPRFRPEFKVGRTKALKALTKINERGYQISRLNSFWNEHKNGAGFLCLQYFHGQKLLRIPKLNGVNFVSRLLAEAEDIEALRKLFGNYEEIARVLERANYKLPRTGIEPTQSDLKFPRLTPEWVDAIQRRDEGI